MRSVQINKIFLEFAQFINFIYKRKLSTVKNNFLRKNVGI